MRILRFGSLGLVTTVLGLTACHATPALVVPASPVERETTAFGLLATLEGGEIPITMAPGFQYRSAVAVNSKTGEHLVVWTDNRTSVSDIYGRLVAANGSPLGPDFAISTAANIQFAPDVAYSEADDAYLVTWEDERHVKKAIYAQRVDADGTLAASGNFPVASGPSNRMAPSLAYDPNSETFLVTWSDDRGFTAVPATDADVYGQRTTIDGSLIGSEIPISTAAFNQEQADVAYSEKDGAYLVTWQDLRNGNTDIYAQGVKANGALVAGGNFPVSTAPANQFIPAVAHDGKTNEFLITWADDRGYAALPSTSADIYARRANVGGPVGPEIPVSTAASQQTWPDVAYSASDDAFLVTWYDDRDGSLDVFARSVEANGSLGGGADFQVTTHPGNQYDPAVAYNAKTRAFFVTWTDDRGLTTTPPTTFDIYGRRLSIADEPCPMDLDRAL